MNLTLHSLAVFLLLSATSTPTEGSKRRFLQDIEDRLTVNTTEELQQRISDSRRGEVVFLDAEEFIFDRSLTFTTPEVRIVGRGPSETIISCAASGLDSALIIRQHGISIEALTFRNCKHSSAVMIFINGSKEETDLAVSFTNVAFHDNGSNTTSLTGAAIRMETCLGANCTSPTTTIHNCTFTGNCALNGGAIFALGFNLVITDSTFRRNEAMTGGAIAAMDASSLKIRGVGFRHNSGLSGGGALAVIAEGAPRTERLSFTFSILDSIFTRNVAFNESQEENNRISGEVISRSDNAGGAILYVATGNLDSNWTVSNSTFLRNFAHNAGAIYIFSSERGVTHRISNSRFISNHARAVAGGIFVFQTDVHITASRFYRNIGFYGGGISITAGSRLNISAGANTKERTQFRGNEAFNGGGIQITYAATAKLEDVDFVNNVGYGQGGALAFHSGINEVSVFGGLFKGNRALVGGGIDVYFGGNLNIHSHLGTPARFENNIASSGGAIYVGHGHTILTGVNLQDAIFTGNMASSIDNPRVPKVGVLELKLDGVVPPVDIVTSNDEIKRVRERYNGYMSIPEGTGGALALSLENVRPFMSGDILFSNVSINNNEALVGGGVGVYMGESTWNKEAYDRCLTRVFIVYDCKRFIFHNVRVTNNVAQFGGGIFITHPSSVDLTCNLNDPDNRKTLHEALSTRMAQTRYLDFRKDLFCTDISDNQIIMKDITQGADIGTSAVTLSFDHPDDVLQETVSGEPLRLSCDNKEIGSCDRTVRIAIKDAFNQTIHGGIEDASLTIALSSPYILGDRRYTARNGVAEINNTFAFGINVLCMLRISSVGRNQVEMNAPFSIRGCHPGEYTHDRYCLRCPPGQYGFNGSHERCEICATHAVCEGGAAIVPEDGFWHSTPFSPYFMRCINLKGCEFENRTRNLTNFYNNVTKLGQKLDSLDLYLAGSGPQPEYGEYNQCAEGYEGVLCGTCSPGFGHSFSGECRACPEGEARTRLFLVLSFVWTVVLIGLNCGLTLQSTRAKIELEVHEIRQAQNQRPAILPRSNAMSPARRNASIRTRHRSYASLEAVNFHHATPAAVARVMIQTVQLTETLKILVNYLQVTSAASNLSSTEWTTGFETLLTVEASLVGFVSEALFVPLECNFQGLGDTPRSIIALWARSLAPIAGTLLLIGILVLFHRFLSPLIEKRGHVSHENEVNNSQPEIYSLSTGIVVVIIVSVYFSYITVISQFLRSVYCIDVDHGLDTYSSPYSQYAVLHKHRVWAEDTSLTCFHGKHLATGIAGIIGLGFSLLLILSVVIWFPLNKHRLGDPKFIGRYWFIYQGYKKQWYTISWEAMILLRKALITAVTVYSVNLGPTLQPPLCVGILILAYFLHSVFQPFRTDQEQVFVPQYAGSILKVFKFAHLKTLWIQFNNSVNLNHLESLSITSSVFVFLSATIFSSEKMPFGGNLSVGVFTLIFNWTFLVYLLYRVYAGIHVLLDSKLEAMDPEFSNEPNGMGILSAISKAFRVLKEWFLLHL